MRSSESSELAPSEGKMPAQDRKWMEMEVCKCWTCHCHKGNASQAMPKFITGSGSRALPPLGEQCTMTGGLHLDS